MGAGIVRQPRWKEQCGHGQWENAPIVDQLFCEALENAVVFAPHVDTLLSLSSLCCVSLKTSHHLPSRLAVRDGISAAISFHYGRGRWSDLTRLAFRAESK